MITRTVKTTRITVTNALTKQELSITVNGDKNDAIKEAQRYIKRNKIVGLAIITKIEDTVEKLVELPLTLFIEACQQYEILKDNVDDKTQFSISITELEKPTDTDTESK